MSTLLNDEIQWVLANSDRYDNFEHQCRVITNITKRYVRNEMLKPIQKWAKTKYIRDEVALLEYFNLQDTSMWR